MTFQKLVAVAALSMGLAATSLAAKGHDQSGGDTAPGVDVGAETVGPAQGLGQANGNDGKNDGKDRGKSADAGRDG